MEGAAVVSATRHATGNEGGGEAQSGKVARTGVGIAIAADILRTAVAPSWRDIGQLAAIAVLRTGLNYGLEREIAREEQREFTCAARASSD